MITATVDNRDVMRKLNKLEQMTGKPLEKLVTQSVRRVCVNLAKTIAPFGWEESAKKSGEAAVMSDYRRSTRVVAPGYMYAVLNKTKGQKKNIDIVLNKADSGEEYRVQWGQISESAKAIRTAHKGVRNHRGRVGRNLTPTPTATTQEGFDKGIKQALRRVGLAKNAYAQAARMVGGTRGIASWVKKSKGVKNIGTATIRKSRAGYIGQIDNKLGYASRILSKSGEMTSLKKESDYLTQQVEREMDRRWKE